MTFISGPYEWYASNDSNANLFPLGVVEDAPELRVSTESDEITGDNLGGMVQGFINRGANVFLSMVFQEWDGVAAQRIFWPFATPGTANSGAFEVGQNSPTDPPTFSALGCVVAAKGTASVLCGQGAPSGCQNPKRFYAMGATLAPGSDYSYLMGSRLKNVGVTMQLLPWVDVAPQGGGQIPTTDPTTRFTHVRNDGRVKCWAEDGIP